MENITVLMLTYNEEQNVKYSLENVNEFVRHL